MMSSARQRQLEIQLRYSNLFLWLKEYAGGGTVRKRRKKEEEKEESSQLVQNFYN